MAVRQAAEAASALRTLAETGRAAEAVGAGRVRDQALARAYGKIDGSDAITGDVAAGLAAADLEACLVAHPAPAQTADWLVDHFPSNLNNATDISLSECTDVLKATGNAGA
ncbi:hypothetical protein [Streptomyces sp. IMTB 1903]|uniref:hypothetical protein n=1 Tax=Streptomyces sp. IMTB 1903 TaxID=1776680 RepID=UPI000A590C94|nr:hypothetical protein [Streptomyces sp. IMTB 1903]